MIAPDKIKEVAGHYPLSLINGCFNLLHAGHVRLVEKAKEIHPYGRIVVALNSDRYLENKYGEEEYVPLYKRARVMEALRNVDWVTSFEGYNCAELILSLRPRYVIKGDDYTYDKLNRMERAAMETVGATLVNVPRDENSSTKLWKFIQNEDETKHNQL